MKTVPVHIYGPSVKNGHPEGCKVGTLTLDDDIMDTIVDLFMGECRVELGGSLTWKDGKMEVADVELLSKPKLPESIG